MTCAILLLTVDLGLARPVSEKLEKLKIGEWDPQTQPSAKSQFGTKGLKVPLNITEFGRIQSCGRLTSNSITTWRYCNKRSKVSSYCALNFGVVLTVGSVGSVRIV